MHLAPKPQRGDSALASLRSASVPQSFASLHIHVVFSTKHRAPMLFPELRPRLHKYLGGVLRDHSCSLSAAGGTSDHIHLLVSLSRTIAIADAVRVMKANSSGWIHKSSLNCRTSIGRKVTAPSPSVIPTSIKLRRISQGRRNIIARDRFRTSTANCFDAMRSSGMKGMFGIDGESTVAPLGLTVFEMS